MSSPTFKAASNADVSWGGAATFSWSAQVVPALTNGYLIIGVGAWKATPASLTSITWNTSTSLASLGTRILSGSGDSLELWGVKNPPAATNAFDFVWDADPASAVIVRFCYENVDQTTPVVGSSYNTATGAASPATVNISAVSGDMVVAFCWNDIPANFTASGAQNLRDQGNYPAIGDVLGMDLVASGASTTMGATYSGGDPWVEAGFALRGISAGATPGFMWLH